MAGRRKDPGADSLELLLDTVCNVFGGIILMAILVVLQAQTSADALPEPKPEEVNRILESRQLRFECERLQERLEALAQHRQEIERTFRATTSPTGERLTNILEEFRKAIEEASTRLGMTETDLRATLKSRAEAAEALRAAEQLAQENEEEVRHFEAELRQSETSLPRQVRLPHRRGRAIGSARYYVVSGDRAYPLERVGWFGGPHRSGHCMVTPYAGAMAARVKPVEGMGYGVPGDEAQAEGFGASLRPYVAGSHYLVFFVYDDSPSFASFQKLKDYVTNRRYAYVAEAVTVEGGTFGVSPTGRHETE